MKKLLALSTTIAAYLTLAPNAFAIGICPTGGSAGTQFNTLCNLDLGKAIGSLINLIFIVAVVAALLYLIYGGFRWLTSTGDKSQVAAAREHIVAAVIGLVIIFLSYFILNFLVKFFIPGFDISTFNLPTVGGGTQ